MEPAEFAQVAEAFRAFCRRYAPLFGTWASQDRGEQYLRGLLIGGAERRNAENLAEQVAGATPRALQQFLTDAPWSAERVIDRLQEDVATLLEEPDAVFIVDETGFAKQGTHSVGVARQYSGTLGKVGNCQVGVFLGYASRHGQALVDGRLYLPDAWTGDRPRCAAARVPAAVGFRTKPELALDLLRAARARGHLGARWVAGDAVYGGNPAFRDEVAADGFWSVLEVPRTTLVRPVRPLAAPLESRRPGGWRPRPDLGPATTVLELAEALPPDGWHVLTLGDGAQGPRVHRFARQAALEVRDGVTGGAVTVLCRRDLDGSDLKLYLTTAPARIPLLVLARVAAARWTVETGFQEAKGHVGLDEYEVRTWPGWHHHVTLALLAGLFLLTRRHQWGGKSAPVDAAPGGPGAPRAAAPTDLDRRRPGGLAGDHPDPQRRGDRLPCQTPAA